MKKFLFVAILLLIGATAFAYTVDHLCMSSGQEVMFFTWGKDYVPVANNTVNEKKETSDAAPEKSEKSSEKDLAETAEINLYFADENIMNLKAEVKSIDVNDDIASEIAKAVIKGPESEELYALIPSETKVLSSVISDDGLCTLNLSKEFCEFDGGSYMENMAVFSLVNSLCSYEKIKSVKINVEGDEAALFGGHYSLEDVFKADDSLIA